MNKLALFMSENPWYVTLIAVVLIVIIAFGCLCASAAILMIVWNYAVVAALTIATPIGFWEAFFLGLVPLFLCRRITWSNDKN